MSDSITLTAVPTRILVPIDFSASSHAALDAATELAAKVGAALYLINIIPEFPSVSLPDTVTEMQIVDLARAEAEKRFAVSSAALKGKGIKVSTSIEVGSDVAGAILEAVDREHVDLIVMTTHGLSGWYPQVFGSVAEKLVRLAHCSVLLLRTPKPESSAKVGFGRPMEWW